VEDEYKKMIEEKIKSDKRINFFGHTAGSIICALAKNLIKSDGYGVASTVLTREIRKLGKSDAERIMEIFDIKERTPENASKIMKIAAVMIGLKFEKKGVDTLITECAYGDCVKEYYEPFICRVCLEYNKGIIHGVLGENFTLDQPKWLINGDEGCSFKLRKRS
jgi:predicted ArsR family transcriptional regulator